MKFFLPKDLSFVTTNVAENESETGASYVTYDPYAGYNKGTIRKYGQNLYEALALIYPIAHYIWEDMIATDKHAVNLRTQTEIYPTAGQILIPITSGVTVVYVRSNQSYYIAKTTATIDFMIESMVSPANFNLVAAPAPYRFEYATPTGEIDTLYWGYNGVANRYRALDRAVGTQMVKHGADLTMTFEENSVNAVSLFYLDATSVDLNVYDIINPASPSLIYTGSIDLTDTSHLNTYEKVCTIPHRLTNSAVFSFDARYAMRIVLTVKNIATTNPKVGAVKIGLLDYLGQTLDGVSLGGKSYNQSEQRPNGEIVWNKDNKESNKVKTLRYNVKLDTETFDAIMTLVTSILDKEVVLLGDDGDPSGYTTLRNYGAITNHSGDLRSNNTKSQLSIEIENFT